MSGLQTCHKCGAQFDVSSFAPGQQFSCGSCGAVLTAHQASPPAKAAPPAPSGPQVTGRAPGSRKPSAARPGTTRPAPKPPQAGRRAAVKGQSASGPRGPQYKPPERRQKPEAKSPKRPARSAARPSRAPREREAGAPRGKNPAMLYGAAAAVVVAVVVALVVTSSGNGSSGSGGGQNTNLSSSGGQPEKTGPKEPDTVASLDAERRESKPRRASELRSFAERYLAVGGSEAEERARELYTELVDQHDANDVKARKFLGWTDFETDIFNPVLPQGVATVLETVTNTRGYPFMQAVQELAARRWLRDEEDIALAKRAVADVKEHLHKLETDNEYRAADRIRANIAQMPLLAPYNYTTRWAPPFLIVYSSKDRMSEYELGQLTYQERKAEIEKLKEKRKAWKRVMDEKEALYSQLYDEYMRHFGERCKLKDLSAPWGGRPDLPDHKRNFEDGVPLVVWIFSDREAFQKHHGEVTDSTISPMAAGYFSPRTSWVYLYDEDASTQDRIFEINKNLHEGTHQLEHWFTRQRTKWRDPRFSQNAVSEGIAEYLGSVELQKDRTLKWTGINQTRLRNMVGTAKAFEQQGREYPIFPIERLATFESYFAAQTWGSREWNVPRTTVMALLYQQAWAFVYFLNHYDDGKYKDEFLDYYNAVLLRMTGQGMSKSTFKRIFRFRDPEDWEEIESEWKSFIQDDLLKRNPADYMYTPPKRDEWPEDTDD